MKGYITYDTESPLSLIRNKVQLHIDPYGAIAIHVVNHMHIYTNVSGYILRTSVPDEVPFIDTYNEVLSNLLGIRREKNTVGMYLYDLPIIIDTDVIGIPIYKIIRNIYTMDKIDTNLYKQILLTPTTRTCRYMMWGYIPIYIDINGTYALLYEDELYLIQGDFKSNCINATLSPSRQTPYIHIVDTHPQPRRYSETYTSTYKSILTERKWIGRPIDESIITTSHMDVPTVYTMTKVPSSIPTKDTLLVPTIAPSIPTKDTLLVPNVVPSDYRPTLDLTKMKVSNVDHIMNLSTVVGNVDIYTPNPYTMYAYGNNEQVCNTWNQLPPTSMMVLIPTTTDTYDIRYIESLQHIRILCTITMGGRIAILCHKTSVGMDRSKIIQNTLHVGVPGGLMTYVVALYLQHIPIGNSIVYKCDSHSDGLISMAYMCMQYGINLYIDTSVHTNVSSVYGIKHDTVPPNTPSVTIYDILTYIYDNEMISTLRDIYTPTIWYSKVWVLYRIPELVRLLHDIVPLTVEFAIITGTTSVSDLDGRKVSKYVYPNAYRDTSTTQYILDNLCDHNDAIINLYT